MLIQQIQNLFQSEFAEQFQPICRISLDDANNEVLCDSTFPCWNFDEIIEQYSGELGIDQVSSPDLLHFEEQQLIFVEFKNGVYDSKTKKNTRAKIVEGPFVGLSELLKSKNIDFNMQELKEIERIYIVVYNEERKNKNNPARKFHQGLNRLKHRSILERYEEIFIQKVHILTPEKFLEYFVLKWKVIKRTDLFSSFLFCPIIEKKNGFKA